MSDGLQGMTLEQLDTLCSAWPGVSHSTKWEIDRVYSVANKMFAVFCTLGPDRGRLSFKVAPNRFLELTEQPGILPAPYMAHNFWISVAEPRRFAHTELVDLIRQSYELVCAGLPKKKQAALITAMETNLGLD